MFKHRIDQTLTAKVVFQWCLLSFNGGCINAGGALFAELGYRGFLVSALISIYAAHQGHRSYLAEDVRA